MRPLLGLTCLALALGGCASTLPATVLAKQYREAICGAADGDAADRTLVSRALAEDADLYVHVHVASHDELLALVGADDLPPIEARMSLVRVSVRSNDLPVDGISLGGAVRGIGAQPVAARAEWNALAWATQEHLPERHAVETYATAGNLGRLAVAGLTFGLSLPFTDFKKGTVMVDASREEYRRTAPHASALFESIDDRTGCHATGDGGSIGQACEGWFVVDRAMTETVTLHVATTFSSSRVGVARGTKEANRTCTVTSASDVLLGPPNDLEASVHRIWDGPNGRRLAEIARK